MKTKLIFTASVVLISLIFSACSSKSECLEKNCRNQNMNLNDCYMTGNCEKSPEISTTPNITVVNVMEEKEIEEKTEKIDSCEELQRSGKNGDVLCRNKPITITVLGQGVAPMNTASPAQAYALAKRAATADSYRLIAEKIKGVYVEGEDLVKNMMVQRSTVRTSVSAMIRNANLVETTFKDGLCEVEMEILIAHSQFLR